MIKLSSETTHLFLCMMSKAPFLNFNLRRLKPRSSTEEDRSDKKKKGEDHFFGVDACILPEPNSSSTGTSRVAKVSGALTADVEIVLEF